MSLWRSGQSGSCRSGSGESGQSGSGSAHEPLPLEDVDLLRKGGSGAVLRACTEPPVAEEGDYQAEQILLDASREVLEEVELAPSTVLLHVYDLNEGVKRANEILTFSSERLAVGGAFHVGVEVYGSEWSYGSYGVCNALPRTAPGHIYQCSVLLGPTGLDLLDFAKVLRELCMDWGAADYQVFGQNCCSFASTLIERLGVGPMPPWVNRFARLGQDARDSWTSLRTLFTQRQAGPTSLGPAGEGASWLGGLMGRLVSSGGDASDSEPEQDLAAGAAAAGPAPAPPRTLVLLGRPAKKVALQLHPVGGQRPPPTPQRALRVARAQCPPSPATGSKAPQQLLQPQPPKPPKPLPSRPGAMATPTAALSRAASFSLKQPGTTAQPPQPGCAPSGTPPGGAPQPPRHHAQGCSAELPPASPAPPRRHAQGCSSEQLPPAPPPSCGCSLELPVAPQTPLTAGPPVTTPPLGQQPQRVVHSPWGLLPPQSGSGAAARRVDGLTTC